MLSKADLSPESLSRVLEQSSDCVKLVDADGALLWMNPNGQCAMEVGDFQSLGGKEWASLWPVETRPLIREAMAAAASGQISRLEAFCPTAKGSPRWWEVSISAVRSPEGAHTGFISISRDVSQLHADREALQTLLAEMRHRLKNSFAMVCAMLRSMARGHEGNTAFAGEMVARISALATAQTLFDGEQAVTALDDLLGTLISPFRDEDRPLIALTCPQAHEVSREHADAISLVIGELTVNSTKHGAIGHGGSITLCALVEDMPDTRQLAITWSEQGHRPVAGTSRPGGQGLTLIERICRARGGSFTIEWQEQGLDARLILPVPAAA
ncbi:sensor histidine kinase [Novosphingobium cyanobacteriorum]|uniref:histidine kinase n=1 Tax=Novosphingobium cyanobacteriorum TaxID=3024215 RepID=A0ABT6CFY6_9SPHN|nr:PAS domain-containing protein [Novosphingobium cyanobacteriorum]MDF8332833.1 PAS domain-containing protein [Novosphingobium cyanobacteriorum]